MRSLKLFAYAVAALAGLVLLAIVAVLVVVDGNFVKSRLERAMQEVPVEVAVRFAPVVVHPRDVIDLAVGDVLPLSHPSTDLLDVVVDGVVLAQAAAGSHGSRLACRVVTVEENHA